MTVTSVLDPTAEPLRRDPDHHQDRGHPMTRPRLLDAFCGAGGCSVGYHRAGFDVVGVDNRPMPRYPFEFIQADAMDVLADAEFLAGFDVIHASPPCQAHTSLKDMWNSKDHPDLVGPVRDALLAWGGPYVIENVPGAPLREPFTLCGSMFGLVTSSGAELRRHRLFETNWHLSSLITPCAHGLLPRVIGVYGGHGRDRRRHLNTQDFTTDERREAMGIDWMTGTELSQAIPPAYCEFIGEQLLSWLRDDERPPSGSVPEHTLGTFAFPGRNTGSRPNTGAPVGNGSSGYSSQSGSLETVACSPEIGRGPDAQD